VRTLAAAVAGLLASLAAASSASAAVSLAQVGTFKSPVYVTAPPGDTTNVYVVEQDGLVKALDGSTFLDLTALTNAGGERGLLSIAFAPDYATSHKVYAYYTAAADGAVTIDEIAGAARRTLLRIPHDRQANHNGGQLQIGPDGRLYAGTGDGGSGGDPSGNGQYTTKAPPSVVNGVNHDWRLGKLLRIDPAGGDPELWSTGLRNPFRFSFDRATGDLIIGDVGQGAVEEIDLAPAPGRGQGLNFGWNRWEGDQAFSGLPPRDGFTFPVLVHRHGEGWCSITGGYVVRDPALPDLLGQYVYGDYCKNELWAARLAPAGATDVRALGLPKVSRLSSFGEDGCGRVYAASLDGPVYRLSDSGACGAAAPPAPAVDRTPPVVTVVRGKAQRVGRLGRVSVRMRCDELCAVSATGRVVFGSARLALRRARVTLAAGAAVRVDLGLASSKRRSVARALRAGRVVRARVSLLAVDAAGNATVRSVTVRARR
jgi:hypothetical protein